MSQEIVLKSIQYNLFKLPIGKPLVFLFGITTSTLIIQLYSMNKF